MVKTLTDYGPDMIIRKGIKYRLAITSVFDQSALL
jgi:hypothetical protein